MVNHDQYANTTDLFAVKKSTKEIYEYKGNPNEWIKIGGPGRTFAAGGAYGVRIPGPQGGDPGRATLYAISPHGEAVWEYSGTPEQWRQIGEDAREIYAGGSNLYATEPTTGDIYSYSGTPDNWVGIGMPGRDFVVDVIGCGVKPWGKTTLYGLSSDGKEIWRYEGKADQWTQIKTSGFTAPLRKIFAAGGQLFTITENDNLYKYVP